MLPSLSRERRIVFPPAGIGSHRNVKVKVIFRRSMEGEVEFAFIGGLGDTTKACPPSLQENSRGSTVKGKKREWLLYVNTGENCGGDGEDHGRSVSRRGRGRFTFQGRETPATTCLQESKEILARWHRIDE